MHAVSLDCRYGEAVAWEELTPVWPVIHQWAWWNVRRAAYSDSVVKPALQKSLALVCDLEVGSHDG